MTSVKQIWARYLEGDNISTKIESSRVEIGEASSTFWKIEIGEASPIDLEIEIDILLQGLIFTVLIIFGDSLILLRIGYLSCILFFNASKLICRFRKSN